MFSPSFFTQWNAGLEESCILNCEAVLVCKGQGAQAGISLDSLTMKVKALRFFKHSELLTQWHCVTAQNTWTLYNTALTYLLTPWCRVLEKLTGLQLVKKFPVFLWNPKFHYRTHKRPPPAPILGQPSPVHIPTSHFLEIHPNIIHPSKPRSPQWSLSLRFPHQDPIRPPLLTHTRHMPSPSHSRLSPAQYWMRSTDIILKSWIEICVKQYGTVPEARIYCYSRKFAPKYSPGHSSATMPYTRIYTYCRKYSALPRAIKFHIHTIQYTKYRLFSNLIRTLFTVSEG